MRQVVLIIDVDTDDPKVARQVAEDLLMQRGTQTKWAMDRLEVWTTDRGDREPPEDDELEIEADYADVIQ